MRIPHLGAISRMAYRAVTARVSFVMAEATGRKRRCEGQAANIGVNLGIAAQQATRPFGGGKGASFGTRHGQARHAVEFFTQATVVVERWPKEWSRQF